MILTLRILASFVILAAWISFSAISAIQRMGAMIAINTYPHFTEQARTERVRRTDRIYWVSLTITGCLSVGLLVLVWRCAES